MHAKTNHVDVIWDMKANKDEYARATEGGTLRADGTRRKERKIRPGYTPPGCVQVYIPRHRRARGEVRVLVIVYDCLAMCGVSDEAWWV